MGVGRGQRSAGWAFQTATIALLVCAQSASARRAATPEVTESVDGVVINWTRGLLIAQEGSSADMRAPTATIARVKAQREAEERARKRVVAVALKLPRAPDASDAASEARTALLGRDAFVLETIYGSDGSTRVTVGLPIESIRRAHVGASSVPDKSAPAAIVVDARAARPRWQIGPKISAGGESYTGPTLYGRVTPARHRKTAVVAARKVTGPTIELDESAAKAVTVARSAGALVFVLVK